jgi:hypothetical protein
MDESVPPELVRYFDRMIEKIEAHPSYSVNVRGAASAGERFILNYHTHGPEHGYCVSICTRVESMAALGLDVPLHELCHIRGIAKDEADCEPLMTVLGMRLAEHYALKEEPRIFLDGKPFERS